MWTEAPAAIGAMRLSTDPARDEQTAIAVLHAGFDAGVTLIDTADAYCLDAGDTGHNERLIARARDSWVGDRSRLRVATKGGLTRPGGQWIPDGRARHLTAACEASLTALGVPRLDLYQLHTVDPRTPLATSVRALSALQRRGLVASIGLCNVTVGQIEEARRHADIAAIQVELGPWRDDHVLSGVVAYCLAHGIRLLAYRPLGGVARRARIAGEATLGAIAARHGTTPHAVALAWLADLSPLIVPLPGPTRVETAQSCGGVRRIALTDEDRAQLDERFPFGAAVRTGGQTRIVAPTARRDGEVVLIMGLPGAGKSTLAQQFVEQGYHRLNRDDAGGTLRSLLPALDRAIAGGDTRLVLDNTYVSRKARAAVVQAARQHDLPVRCVWLTTSIEDAQINVAWRSAEGGATFAPTVQFRYQRAFEPPDASEGFSTVERVDFARRRDPNFTHRALIVWCDGVLWDAEGVVRCERAETLRAYQRDGFRILGMSWQPGIAGGTVSPDAVEARIAALRAALEVDIEVEYCPHGGGPPECWCRKPLPGLGVTFIRRHRLDPAQCLYVGAGTQDPGFARRLGFRFARADEFFPQR